jgi:tetraacyldisaccharide 4'-kinase
MLNKKNILLYPLSLIFGVITAIRNILYNAGILHSVEFHFPVICVGNITVGGTGKTPHTEYLAELLRKNFKVATLSRGYKRKTSDFRIATEGSLVSEIGDEPLQIFTKFPDIIVAVDRNRVNGINSILQAYPETEVVILDDAFQHRRITPGFSILLSDFERPMTKDHLLPYGNLREYKENMRRADIILITKSPMDLSAIQRRLIVKEIDKAPYQNLYFTSINYQTPVPVFSLKPSGEVLPVPNELQGCSIVLVTGIANPIPLKEHLQQSAGEIIHLSFPDHHNFTETDISNISTAFENIESSVKYLFTTEKDAVRLREFTNIAEIIKQAFYYIPVGIQFLNEDKDEFDNLIIDYVRKNIRNNRIS